MYLLCELHIWAYDKTIRFLPDFARDFRWKTWNNERGIDEFFDS